MYNAEANEPIDAAALAIARAAMRKILAEVVSHVDCEWKRFAAACPTATMCNSWGAVAETLKRLLKP